MLPTEYVEYDSSLNSSSKALKVLSWFDNLKRIPNLMAVYFPEVDQVGHAVSINDESFLFIEAGPDSDRVDEALIDLDKSLGILIRGLSNKKMLSKVIIE